MPSPEGAGKRGRNLSLGFAAADFFHREPLHLAANLWWPWVLIGAAIVFLLGYRSIRVSAKTGTILGLFEIGVFVVAPIWLIAKADHNPRRVHHEVREQPELQGVLERSRCCEGGNPIFGLDELVRDWGSFLVAGDWNTARGQGSERGRRAGEEFFDRVGEKGWYDCVWEKLGKEVKTWFREGDELQQDDHVFCDRGLGFRLQESPWVAASAAMELGLSDHAPLIMDFDVASIALWRARPSNPTDTCSDHHPAGAVSATLQSQTSKQHLLGPGSQVAAGSTGWRSHQPLLAGLMAASGF